MEHFDRKIVKLTFKEIYMENVFKNLYGNISERHTVEGGKAHLRCGKVVCLFKMIIFSINTYLV